MTAAATPAELVAPLRAEPARAAILLDVDGTLAPIVRHADDANVPEATRSQLIAIAGRYGLVACVTGRRATEARRIVSIGSIAYLGNHGTELLRPGGISAEIDPALRHWAGRVREFVRSQHTDEIARLRIRLEDKEVISAFHWRGVPDEEAGRAAVARIAHAAEEAGLATHWGRKVLEVRPPVRMDKGAGIQSLLRDHDVDAAMYVGDDRTDLDAFRALGDLLDRGRLDTVLRIGVSSDEVPAEIEAEADAMVEGTQGVQRLLRTLAQD